MGSQLTRAATTVLAGWMSYQQQGVAVDRITRAQVRQAYDSFVSDAKEAGFDTTQWNLEEPITTAGPYRLFVKDAPGGLGGPFPSTLDTTTRETYNRLCAWSQALIAMKHNGDKEFRNWKS